MGAVFTLTEDELDQRWPSIEAKLRDWYTAETATTFDQAVRQAAGEDIDLDDDPEEEGLTVWDEMPELDSKRVVDALVEIEPLIGEKIPVDVIRPGGYGSADELVEDLRTKLRGKCRSASEAPKRTSTPPRAA